LNRQDGHLAEQVLPLRLGYVFVEQLNVAQGIPKTLLQIVSHEKRVFVQCRVHQPEQHGIVPSSFS
tara:strand:- start:301 stop:498 length:198 start_codon:yes stop_codon:yes gene_type:complete